MNHPVLIRLRGFDSQFQGVERGAGVAVGDIGQVRERVFVQGDFEVPKASDGVLDGLADDLSDVVISQWLELEDAAAGDQCAVHREVWILGGGANQDDGAVFDPRQQSVLLCFVPAVDFVNK